MAGESRNTTNEQSQIGNNRLYLRVINREKVVYDGEVESVSSVNDKGEFDVLALHSRFISIIQDRLVIRELDGSVVEQKVEKGIMRVHEKGVQVFLGLG